MLLSLIVPCFNEEKCISIFRDAVLKLNLPLDLEFWFIDDGSRDNTLGEIKKLADIDDRVHYISFSRNFGKEAALYAGMQNASGDLVVTMDADLQHPPELLPEMLKIIQQGNCESVATYRASRRGELRMRSFFSECFYKLMNLFSEIKLNNNACDYRMMTRKFVDTVLSLTEVNRFTKGIYSWVGYRTEWLPFDNVQRSAGETKWSFWGLMRYSMNGLSAFSTAPLFLASLVGLLCCFAAFAFAVYVVIRTYCVGEVVRGYPTLVCLILLLGGGQFLCIGILGIYLAKMYKEIKHRPIYIVSEKK